jgi:hypothetical protein
VTKGLTECTSLVALLEKSIGDGQTDRLLWSTRGVAGVELGVTEGFAEGGATGVELRVTTR